MYEGKNLYAQESPCKSAARINESLQVWRSVRVDLKNRNFQAKTNTEIRKDTVICKSKGLLIYLTFNSYISQRTFARWVTREELSAAPSAPDWRDTSRWREEALVHVFSDLLK
jgi:hypothetical protein